MTVNTYDRMKIATHEQWGNTSTRDNQRNTQYRMSEQSRPQLSKEEADEAWRQAAKAMGLKSSIPTASVGGVSTKKLITDTEKSIRGMNGEKVSALQFHADTQTAVRADTASKLTNHIIRTEGVEGLKARQDLARGPEHHGWKDPIKTPYRPKNP